MNETRFHFPAYSPERLWSARWQLFEFPEVRNLAHVNRDVVVVYHDGDPRIDQLVELLRERGFEFHPVVSGQAAA
jgi:hypothetical protein